MESISTSLAPAPVGPYSQAVKVGGIVYLSGQIGLDPVTGVLVLGGVEKEIHQVFANLQQVLAAAGSSPQHVVKVTVLLTRMEDFAVVNELYAKFFEGNAVMPARTTFAVAGLPKSAQVEIDCVALVANGEEHKQR